MEQGIRGTASAHQALPGYATGQDFLNDTRIHIKHGSEFVGPGLAIHPEDRHPANEARLRRKLENAYKYNAPSFFDDEKRFPIALHLGAAIPPTLRNEHAALTQQVEAFNERMKLGISEQAMEAASFYMPMQSAAMQLQMDQNRPPNPLAEEYGVNGLAYFLMLREAMSRKGYFKPLTDYISDYDSPDQVIASLQGPLGLDVRAMRETALNGIGAIGEALGLDADTVYSIRAISQYVAQKRFSLNAIEHWHLGRQLQPNADIETQIAVGMQARIDADVKKYQEQAQGWYQVPDYVKAQEVFVAQALELIEPAERDVLFRLGAQIGYAPDDRVADGIAEFPGILGLHRTLSDDLAATDGNYFIYFAGQLDEKKALRTLRHEIAHNLWPTRFSEAERVEVDRLIESDNQHITSLRYITTTEHKWHLQHYVTAYQAAQTDGERQEVIKATNAHFAPLNISFDAILPHLKGVEQLSWMVSEAYSKLRLDGPFYNKTAYHGVPVRFREMISRYSELQYIAHLEQPDMQAMLEFVTPGMHRVFNHHYLPHIEALREELVNPPLAQQAQNDPQQRVADAPGREPRKPPLPTAAAQGELSVMPGAQVSQIDTNHMQRFNLAASALAQQGISPRISPVANGVNR